jgi:hypothetical protein
MYAIKHSFGTIVALYKGKKTKGGKQKTKERSQAEQPSKAKAGESTATPKHRRG